jgi:hypothetical protein
MRFPHFAAALCALSLSLLNLSLVALPVRVDLSPDTDRHDTATLGWEEWQAAEGREISRVFDSVEVRIAATGDEAMVRGEWLKDGLVSGATMATDAVKLPAGAAGELKITLSGLPSGRHSIATYHNTVRGEAAGPYHLWAKGAAEDGVEVSPSRQVARNAQVASAYLEFSVEAGEPAVFYLSRVDPRSADPIFLNGFEIDDVNPSKRAKEPRPASEDWHVDGDDGSVTLEWMKAPSAVLHRVYLFSGDDLESVERAVADASGDDGLVGIFVGDRATVAVDPDDSLRHYAWRVDSVDAEGTVTRGDGWTFRVRHLAFPGAEGYGRFAIGGRGGRVIKVTNLNDRGPGSLRAAVEAEGPRTVIFDVSGRIVLESGLAIRNPFITIAGQTAPGKGICLSNYNFGMLGGRDAIVRFIRVRPGDTSGRTLDGMGMASSDHCIIDHCSISWSHDEAFSSRGARNITLQRTLISEALNIAGHSSYGEGKQHGFAASIGGDIGSFHHNLLAHNAGRNWSLAGALDKATRHTGRLDIRNNVVYNWGHRTTDGGAKEVNFVNNYYKPGPASQVFHVLMPERKLVEAFGPQDYYVAGNVMEGHYGADEPYAGIRLIEGATFEAMLVEEPFFPSFVETRTAEEAYENVLADVGANVPMLDDHDRRVIEETRTGTVTYEGSRSGLPGLPDSQEDVGGWEDYPEIHRPADWDTDHDGMPNAWERTRGFDPEDPGDGALDADRDGYTNLEEYLNELAANPGR